mmetsp:Transcript_73744/g.194487  ORF Transcript_73744/g.194487 Transcript_73744/m.194487 type:complete len:261 (-) Transcript_73744:448-1230(-)
MCRAGHEGGVHVRGALVVMVRACKCWTGRLCAAPQLKAGDLRGRPGEELRGQRELRDGHGVRVAPLASALREALPACASHWHGGLDRKVRAARLRRDVHCGEVPAEDAIGAVADGLEEALVELRIVRRAALLVAVEVLPHVRERKLVLGHAVHGVAEATHAFGGVEVGQGNLRRESVDDLVLGEVVGDVDVLHGRGFGTQNDRLPFEVLAHMLHLLHPRRMRCHLFVRAHVPQTHEGRILKIMLWMLIPPRRHCQVQDRL